MAYLMAGVGNFLNSKFDSDNDSIVDVGSDTCDTAQLTDFEVAELGSALVKIFNSSLNISDVALLEEVRGDVESGCNGLGGISSGLNFCGNQDPASYTPAELRGIRSLVQEGEILGVGSCSSVPNSLANCICL